MRKILILIFILAGVLLAMCSNLNNSDKAPPEGFERNVRIVTLADFLHNSNWSMYYPNEDPFKWDERTAVLKLKPILENFKWSDGERVIGVDACHNTTANRTFLLVNLSWGEFIVVEPVVDERYQNWSLYQIGRVYSFEDYLFRCDRVI